MQSIGEFSEVVVKTAGDDEKKKKRTIWKKPGLEKAMEFRL